MPFFVPMNSHKPVRAITHEMVTRTLLLQSRLDYIRARDEMTEAIGRTPE